MTTRDQKDTLVYEASHSGRFAYVTTYYDTPTSPQKATLLFNTPQEAEAFATLVAGAKMPGNVKRSADTGPEHQQLNRNGYCRKCGGPCSEAGK